LQINKHVFVEKPLALTDEQLDGIASAAATSSGHLMVGFNRRFSPLARQAKELFAAREARFRLSIVLTRVESKDHWTQNEKEGGGRIVGEVCHFIDLMTFLTDAKPVSCVCPVRECEISAVIDSDSVVHNAEVCGRVKRNNCLYC
jgi:polar amino acid transport system substrate-binding protein